MFFKSLGGMDVDDKMCNSEVCFYVEFIFNLVRLLICIFGHYSDRLN